MMKRELFKLEGEKIVRLRKNCPKCGDGVFLAEHKDRLSCGRCGYTEFKGKRERPVEEKKEGASTEKPIVEPEKTEKKEIVEQPKGEETPSEEQPEEKVEETEKPTEEEPVEKPEGEKKATEEKPAE